MSYSELLEKAWSKYCHEWAECRGYTFQSVLQAFRVGLEFHGEMWACLDEFECCEFLMEEYMKELLSPEDFLLWLEFVPENERE